MPVMQNPAHGETAAHLADNVWPFRFKAIDTVNECGPPRNTLALTMPSLRAIMGVLPSRRL